MNVFVDWLFAVVRIFAWCLAVWFVRVPTDRFFVYVASRCLCCVVYVVCAFLCYGVYPLIVSVFLCWLGAHVCAYCLLLCVWFVCFACLFDICFVCLFVCLLCLFRYLSCSWLCDLRCEGLVVVRFKTKSA